MPLALRFLSGPLAGSEQPLDPEVQLVVGRREGANCLALDDELVSRAHASFAFEGGELTVEDLGSTNGTWVNGARVAASATVTDAADHDLVLLAALRGRVDDILDATPLPDLEAAQRLATLLTRGVLRAAAT